MKCPVSLSEGTLLAMYYVNVQSDNLTWFPEYLETLRKVITYNVDVNVIFGFHCKFILVQLVKVLCVATAVY